MYLDTVYTIRNDFSGGASELVSLKIAGQGDAFPDTLPSLPGPAGGVVPPDLRATLMAFHDLCQSGAIKGLPNAPSGEVYAFQANLMILSAMRQALQSSYVGWQLHLQAAEGSGTDAGWDTSIAGVHVPVTRNQVEPVAHYVGLSIFVPSP